MLLLVSIFLIFFISWYFFGSHEKPGRGGKNLPPSPPALPIIGNLHQLGRFPHISFRNLSQKYGPLMHLQLGSKPALIVSSADAAKEVLKTHDLAFAARPEMVDFKKIFYGQKDLIHMTYGDEWRKMKAIFVQELLGSSRLKSFTSVVEEETALLVRNILECSLSGSPVNLTEMLAALTYDLICRVAIGEKLSETEHGKKFLEVLDETAGLLSRFTPGEFVPWLGWINRVNGYNAAVDRCAKVKDEIIDAVVEDHLKRGVENLNKGNFMDILLGIYKGNSPGVSIDLVAVKASILDVFAAGTETSSTTLVWAMTELIRHPAAMRKLQNEVREVMREKNRITQDELQKMHYLKAVIKETLRFRPPLVINYRASREHVNVNGFDIAPKTWVLINTWAIGRDPARWVEPEKFMPERFLNSSMEFIGGFDLIPFGAGRRICLGLGFALNTIEYTLANLMHKFDWGLPGGAKGEDMDVTEKSTFVIAKKTPLIVVARSVT